MQNVKKPKLRRRYHQQKYSGNFDAAPYENLKLLTLKFCKKSQLTVSKKINIKYRYFTSKLTRLYKAPKSDHSEKF